MTGPMRNDAELSLNNLTNAEPKPPSIRRFRRRSIAAQPDL